MTEDGIHLRLGDILYGLRKHSRMTALLCLAGFLVGFALSGGIFFFREENRGVVVTSSFSIHTASPGGTYASGGAVPGYNDLLMASELMGSAAYVVQSDRMLQGVIDQLGLSPVTPEDLRKNLTAVQYAGTQIMEVSLSWESAAEGIRILDELNRMAPELLQEALRVGTVAVIDPPAAEENSLYRAVALWIAAALAGFLLALALIVAGQLARPTLLRPQELETDLRMELLGQIRQGAPLLEGGRVLPEKGRRRDPAEASLAAAANLLECRLGNQPGPRILVVTSAQRGEGRTGVAANLAVALSRLGRRVLLLDLDLQKPRLAGRFFKKVPYSHSLNALRAGAVPPEDAVISLGPCLDLLPTLPERNGLRWSGDLVELVTQLARGYDYVLIDSAPVGLSAEGIQLNTIATGVLFVARCDTASLRALREARNRTVRSGGRILGCLANGVPPQGGRYPGAR